MKDHGLNAVQRGDQPCLGLPAVILVSGQEPLVLFAQIEQDRATFEQAHFAVIESGHLTERLPLIVILAARYHRIEQFGAVGTTDLLHRPAYAEIAHQPMGEGGGTWPKPVTTVLAEGTRGMV